MTPNQNAYFLKTERDGRLIISFNLHVKPGAKKNAWMGMHGDAIKVSIKAPPEDGRANDALIEFIAETFNVGRKDVTLIRGQTSKQKVFEVKGVDAEVWVDFVSEIAS